MTLGSGCSRAATVAQRVDFRAGLYGNGACFLNDRLKLGQEQIDRVSHFADFVCAVDLHALGEIAVARRQPAQCGVEQAQPAQHLAPKDQRDGEQQQCPGDNKADADFP